MQLLPFVCVLQIWRIAGTFAGNCILVHNVEIFACLMPVVGLPDNKKGKCYWLC